jgi:hypothetical protein
VGAKPRSTKSTGGKISTLKSSRAKSDSVGAKKAGAKHPETKKTSAA